jgi:hypothetical protein
MNTEQAKAIFEALNQPEPVKRLALLISGIETQLLQRVAAANNWGNVTAPKGYTGKVHAATDKRFDPATNQIVTYTTNFPIYDTPEAGADALCVFLVAHYPEAIAAITEGNTYAAAKALRDRKYYLGVKPYLAAIADYSVGMGAWAQRFGWDDLQKTSAPPTVGKVKPAHI